MTAEQDGLDLAGVLAFHVGEHECSGGKVLAWPMCEPYRLAALALDLQGRVARVEALPEQWARAGRYGSWRCEQDVRAALTAVRNEPTCARPEGHEGAHLFTSYDGTGRLITPNPYRTKETTP